MTKDELNKYYHLKIEIEYLKQKIDEFGDGVKSQQFSEDKVSSSHKNKSIQETKVELVAILTEKRISALEEYIKIEQYIDNVDDPELRNIMRFRFLDCMDWEDIGNKYFMDRTTVAKKVNRYIKKKS